MPDIPSDVLEAFSLKMPVRVRAFGSGIIHHTYYVESPKDKFVLQSMNPAIATSVVEDMKAVTDHLAAKGVPTFTIVLTKEGSATHESQGKNWRLLTFIDGRELSSPPNPGQAKSSASLLAVFHVALAEYTRPFSFRNPAMLNPPFAFEAIASARGANISSAKKDACDGLTEEILKRSEKIELVFADLPPRVLHGDPKKTNFLFDEIGQRAVALVDLDHVNTYKFPLELGDMLRSFCKGKGGVIDVDLWRAVLDGYRASADFLTSDERTLVPDGFVAVTLALAARYVTDAYEERYFAHDASKFESLFEQNVSKAKSCLTLLNDFRAKESEIRKVIL